MARRKKWKPPAQIIEKERVSRKVEWSVLDPIKHGVGGLIRGKLKPRKQDKRALSDHCYAVVFFPRISGIGKARVHMYIRETMSASPEAAVSKFMDRIARNTTWAEYYKAGHRIRKIKLTDLGDAPLGRKNV